jgi:hypothetical protein
MANARLAHERTPNCPRNADAVSVGNRLPWVRCIKRRPRDDYIISEALDRCDNKRMRS